MPSRKDETWLNIHPHPPTCSCHDCVLSRNKRRYPYPASLECPYCGHLSLYHSDKLTKYICMNEHCKSEGKTLKEISDKKDWSDKRLKGLLL